LCPGLRYLDFLTDICPAQAKLSAGHPAAGHQLTTIYDTSRN
jgi:hypothetical protein